MKFKVYQCKDIFGDKLRVDAFNDGSFSLAINRSSISLTREEARKFAKAIRKQVKLAEMGDLNG